VYNPDGSRLLSLSTDNTIRLWDGETGELLHELPDFRNPASHLRFDSTGTLHSLEIARDALVIRQNGQPVNGVSRFNDLGANPPIDSVIPCADFSVIIARETGFPGDFSDRQSHTIWDMTTGERVLPFPADNYHVVTINSSGTLLAASGDGKVRLWDIGTQTSPTILMENPELNVWGLTFSPNDQLLAGIINPPGSAVKLWDLVTGGQRSITLPDTEARILSLTFSPDSHTIVAQTWESGIWILPLETDTEPVVLLPGFTGARRIAFSWDFSLIALATADEIQLWNSVTGTKITSFSASNIVSMAFNQDTTTLLAAGMGDGTTKLWGIR
jgi:WD40 repeat protein